MALFSRKTTFGEKYRIPLPMRNPQVFPSPPDMFPSSTKTDSVSRDSSEHSGKLLMYSYTFPFLLNLNVSTPLDEPQILPLVHAHV